MQPDIPILHSSYTPLGRQNTKLKDQQAKVLEQVPVLKETLERWEAKIKQLQDYSSLPTDQLLDEKKLGGVILGRKETINWITSEKNALQQQLNLLEFSPEGVEEPQGA